MGLRCGGNAYETRNAGDFNVETQAGESFRSLVISSPSRNDENGPCPTRSWFFIMGPASFKKIGIPAFAAMTSYFVGTSARNSFMAFTTLRAAVVETPKAM